MAGTPFDSALLSRLFATGEAGRLFTDSAEVRAMLIALGALAKVQGARGLIPAEAAAFVHRSSLEVQIDPGALAVTTGQNGVTVPALVAAFRKAMEAPDFAQYAHWGATSQDIQDTALTLRLRQYLALAETALRRILAALARQATAHADLPMAARTYGQNAVPTSFGAVVAAWGWPLIEALRDLDALRARSLVVSLAGAAGTASELGPDSAALRADFAAALGLGDPGRSWHADRGPVLALAGWLVRVTAALGKMGEDMLLMTQSGIGELSLGASGGSSTMPQKQNPVGPSVLVALARHAGGLGGTLATAATPRQQRDGAAWFTEWLCLPQLCLSTFAALERAADLAEGMAPVPDAMRRGIAAQGGTIMAEALSFALSTRMPRPEAQAAVKALCAGLGPDDTLIGRARAEWPDLDAGALDPARAMGTAPQDAANFALQVAAL